MSSATSGSEFPAPNLPPRTKKPGPRSKPAGEAAGDQGDDPALSNDRDAARGPVLPALPTRRHREKQRSIRRPKFGTWTVATSLLLFATVALYGYGTATLVEGNESPLGGIVLLPMLIGLAVLITWKASAAETRFDLRGIMIFGLALRLMSAYFRFLASVDATVYHQEGSRIVPELRNFNFWVDTGRPVPGTGCAASSFFRSRCWVLSWPRCSRVRYWCCDPGSKTS